MICLLEENQNHKENWPPQVSIKVIYKGMQYLLRANCFNNMKCYEIWPKPKCWVQEIFQTLLPNFVTSLTQIGSNYVHFAWMKVRELKPRVYL
jgi:hypothetical protein